MSDTEIFKSSLEAAGNIAAAIGQAAAAGESSLNISISVTHLTVVNNIRFMAEKFSQCNAAFKQLVTDDSNNILNLAECFDDFDAGMSENMGIQ